MPNGHGGYVRFLSVAALLLLLGGVFAGYLKSPEPWLLYAGYAVAALLGERFAHNLHMWKAEEYDGVYLSDDEKIGARKTYIVAAVIYVIGAVVAWDFLTTK